eukprot:gene6899-7594_t
MDEPDIQQRSVTQSEQSKVLQSSSSVRVAVRVRPFNQRELRKQSKCIITMHNNVTQVENPHNKHQSTFAFDFSHWSHNKVPGTTFADQATVYNDMGQTLLYHAFAGYNACILAYGQTGAGKSYTMMGCKDDDESGIIPRLCKDMFGRIENMSQKNKSDFIILVSAQFRCTVEVSYLEIYNERVRDLLNPLSSSALRVRDHPATGPYVEDLSQVAVMSYEDIYVHIGAGNRSRKVASTDMNKQSSRSHAIFTIKLTLLDNVTFEPSKIILAVNTYSQVSKMNLVDLAGSERVHSTGATGARFKEGTSINRSLACLGKVISALAAQDDTNQKKKRARFVPYRESSLTWLLKESLGGNSKTSMIAAISPADVNFEETLSTLRYMDRAKQIVCRAIVNEDPTSRIIRELQEEVRRLEQLLKSQQQHILPLPETSSMKVASTALTSLFNIMTDAGEKLEERLAQSQKLMNEMTITWEEKLARAESLKLEREETLRNHGIKLSWKGDRAVGVHGPRDRPHLVNVSEYLNEDELLIYHLLPGKTIVTSARNYEEPLQSASSSISNKKSDALQKSPCQDEATATLSYLNACESSFIHLIGRDIHSMHCTFENEDNTVRLTPLYSKASVSVDGEPIFASCTLSSGSLIQLGTDHVFRFIHPHQQHNVTTPSLESSKFRSRYLHTRRRESLQAIQDNDRLRFHSPVISSHRNILLCNGDIDGSLTAGLEEEVVQLLRMNGALSLHALEGLLFWRRGIKSSADASMLAIRQSLHIVLSDMLAFGYISKRKLSESQCNKLNQSNTAEIDPGWQISLAHFDSSAEPLSLQTTSRLVDALALDNMQKTHNAQSSQFYPTSAVGDRDGIYIEPQASLEQVSANSINNKTQRIVDEKKNILDFPLNGHVKSLKGSTDNTSEYNDYLPENYTKFTSMSGINESSSQFQRANNEQYLQLQQLPLHPISKQQRQRSSRRIIPSPPVKSKTQSSTKPGRKLPALPVQAEHQGQRNEPSNGTNSGHGACDTKDPPLNQTPTATESRDSADPSHLHLDRTESKILESQSQTVPSGERFLRVSASNHLLMTPSQNDPAFEQACIVS